MAHSGSPAEPRLALVVGVGRSGTSAMAGALAELGFAVPQPEIAADESNPRGFGEPEWIVELHAKILRRHGISAFDGRPDVWRRLDRVAQSPAGSRLHEWLGGQLKQHDRIVVKDPRTVLFIGLWRAVLGRLAVPTTVVTMLRPPGEVVASARRHYGGERWDAARLAGWVNVMLAGESATREESRVFVRYHELLRDWRTELARVAPSLGAAESLNDPARGAAIDRFLEPTLHREQASLDTVDAPDWLRSLADRLWDALSLLADDGERRPELDALRVEYDARYAESVAVVHHTIKAAGRAGRRAPAGAGGREPTVTP